MEETNRKTIAACLEDMSEREILDSISEVVAYIRDKLKAVDH
jgi:hypothetical protein